MAEEAQKKPQRRRSSAVYNNVNPLESTIAGALRQLYPCPARPNVQLQGALIL